METVTKNTKNFKISVSKLSSHDECRHNAIINNFVALKHGHLISRQCGRVPSSGHIYF